ncbi:MAG: deoxyribodipyrimidine photo-lyase, partial [Bacteroidota bacterium]
MNQAISIFWHRRDLRLEDNAGAYEALKGNYPVLPLFIFDKHILDKLEDKDDARVTFIHQEIERLHQELKELGSTIIVKYGYPEEVWTSLLEEYDIKAVYTNRDYEPYALERDHKINDQLSGKGIEFHTYKDHVIFEQLEVTKKDGKPYTVFTPYSKVWKAKLDTQISSYQDQNISYFFKPYPNEEYFSNYLQ